MNDEQEYEYLWTITHDTHMQHFVLALHTDFRLHPREFLEELASLVDKYAENPEEMFDGAEIIQQQ